MVWKVANIALPAAIPGGGQIKPQLWVSRCPIHPGQVEQLGCRINALLCFAPVEIFQLGHGLAQLHQHVSRNGFRSRGDIRRHQFHQLGADFLMGESCNAAALLQGAIGDLGEGGRRHRGLQNLRVSIPTDGDPLRWVLFLAWGHKMSLLLIFSVKAASKTGNSVAIATEWLC